MKPHLHGVGIAIFIAVALPISLLTERLLCLALAENGLASAALGFSIARSPARRNLPALLSAFVQVTIR